MTPTTETVLKSLRDNTEGPEQIEADGRVWDTVYLDNAIPQGMTPHAFAGHLSALERVGLYRPHGDDCFGDVLTDA